MSHKIGLLAWIGVVAGITFPLAAAVEDAARALLGFPLSDNPAFSWLYSVLAVVSAIVLARPMLHAGGLRNCARIALIWSATTVVTWIGLEYLLNFGTPTRTLSLALFLTHASLTLGGLLLYRRRGMAALAAGTAVVALSFHPEVWGVVAHVPRLEWPPKLAAFLPLAGEGRLPLLLFVISGFATRLLLGRWIRASGSIWRDSVSAAIWVIAVQFTWLAALFAFGALADVPRWLPVMTLSVMAFFAAVLPFLVKLIGGEAKWGQLIYRPRIDADANAWATLVRGPHRGVRRAWVISYTGVSNEPRVLRQCEALVGEGWEVVVCGFDGHSPRPEAWNFVRLPSTDAFRPWYWGLLKNGRKLAQWLTLNARPRSLFKWAQHLDHGANPLWRHLRLEILRIARENIDLRPDLVIAHDYHTSDVGYELAKEFGAKFSVDVHEYAVMQYSNDPQWVRNVQPVIRTVQDHYFRKADVLTVVGAGIAELVAQETPLKRPPVVIRNVPFANPQTFRPVGDRIKVLYHGDLSRPREIDMAIRSMPMWRNEFDLVLRGNGDPAYIGELKRLVSRLGLEQRVTFEPAVPFDQIVPAANSADIGYFAYRAYSPQIQFALPNKFFEYVMAGIAVCISDLREVGALVREHNVGLLIPEHTPEVIANTVNSFNPDSIARFKRASLTASETLNWETERKSLLAAYDALWEDAPSNVTSLSRKRRDTAFEQSMRGAQQGVSR
jgi:glycosyltransferase involved in cell wall biosynthesis